MDRLKGAPKAGEEGQWAMDTINRDSDGTRDGTPAIEFAAAFSVDTEGDD